MTQKKLSFEDVLSLLGFQYYSRGNTLRSNCLVHNGDNTSSLCVYKDTQIWKCYSHNCEDMYGPGIFGLIFGVLDKHTGTVTKRDVYDWIASNGEIENLNIDIPTIEMYKEHNSLNLTRRKFLSKVKVPSEYYINRGFSRLILEKYDVGTATNPNKWGFGSAIIPIFDLLHKKVIAFSMRRDTEEHDKRWIHSKGKWRQSSLYNSWFARSYILKSKTVIITEGPGKVWRLEECGVHNSIGIYGTKMSSNQLKLLSRLGPHKVTLMFDNDENKSGVNAMSKVATQLESLYNVEIIHTKFNDIDSTGIEEVKEFIYETGLCQ